MKQDKNFLDNLDSGWSELIEDTYKNNQQILFNIKNTNGNNICLNIKTNDETTTKFYIPESLKVLRLYDNIEEEYTSDIEYCTEEDYIKFKITVKYEDLIIDDMTVEEYIQNDSHNYTMSPYEDTITLWFEARRNGYVNFLGSIIYIHDKETYGTEEERNTIMSNGLFKNLFK